MRRIRLLPHQLRRAAHAATICNQPKQLPYHTGSPWAGPVIAPAVRAAVVVPCSQGVSGMLPFALAGAPVWRAAGFGLVATSVGRMGGLSGPMCLRDDCTLCCRRGLGVGREALGIAAAGPPLRHRRRPSRSVRARRSQRGSPLTACHWAALPIPSRRPRALAVVLFLVSA